MSASIWNPSQSTAIVDSRYGLDMTKYPFNCDNTGLTDCSDIINGALTNYVGRPLYFPKGIYRCNSTINIKPAATWGVFGPGVVIFGDGVGSTFFDSRVANGPLFDIDSPSHGGQFTANMGTSLFGFNIITTNSAVNSTGIRVLNGFQIDFQQLVIRGLSGNGIELKNGLYSDDGWNRVTIRQLWIDTIAGWGVKADGSSSRNEGSYTYMESVFFQSCGTDDGGANPPTSGAMIWKGQVLTMEQVGAANGTNNVAFYFKGDTGLGQTVDMRNCTSENTNGWGVFCTGIDIFKARNVQLYNNTVYTAPTMCEFDGSSYTVRQIDWDGGAVRAAGLNMTGSVSGTVLTITAVAGGVEQNIVVGSKIYGTGITVGSTVVSFGTGTGGTGTYNLSQSSAPTGSITIKGAPTTAFKLSGSNVDLATCRVKNVAWENFDFPDQTRFNGWEFDPVEQQCELEVTSGFARYRAAQTIGRGRGSPLRLRAGRGGVSSISGEWTKFISPTSGVVKLTGTLTANAVYYIYLYDIGAGTASLEFSTAVPVLDTASGYMVKTGDAALYYIGAAKTDGAGTAFLTSAIGWLNPEVIYRGATSTGVPYYRWTDSTGDVRVKTTAPTSDTDGTVVGTQT